MIGDLCVKCLCVSGKVKLGSFCGQVEFTGRAVSFVAASLSSVVAMACMRMLGFGPQVMPATKLRISLGPDSIQSLSLQPSAASCSRA